MPWPFARVARKETRLPERSGASGLRSPAAALSRVRFFQNWQPARVRPEVPEEVTTSRRMWPGSSSRGGGARPCFPRMWTPPPLLDVLARQRETASGAAGRKADEPARGIPFLGGGAHLRHGSGWPPLRGEAGIRPEWLGWGLWGRTPWALGAVSPAGDRHALPGLRRRPHRRAVLVGAPEEPRAAPAQGTSGPYCVSEPSPQSGPLGHSSSGGELGRAHGLCLGTSP